MAERTVYFIQAVVGGPIKIGSSINPSLRLATIAAWSPFPLEMLATVKGCYSLERRFHAAFRSSHSHQEWFLPTPRLLQVIARLKAGVPVDELGLDLDNVKPANLKTPEQKRRFHYSHAVTRTARNAQIKVPATIDGILEAWRGKNTAEKRPSPAEISMLDAFISNPLEHAEAANV